MSKLYKGFRGGQVFCVEEEKTDPIIDGVLYHKDYVMVAAEEKAGKTVFMQQMACNLTTGKPFLGVFNIPKAVNVWYFATEGKDNDIRDRFRRIRLAHPANEEKIALFSTAFRFNTDIGMKCIQEIMAANEDLKPDVIIVDALYRAVRGSLKSDDVVNDFHAIMGGLQSHFECAIVLVHHLTKPSRDEHGKYMERTDKDAFGSAFLGAAVDHIIRLEKLAKTEEGQHEIVMRCDTQRSGNIFDSVRLRMFEPEPLYFETVEKYEKEKHRVLEVLKSLKGNMSSSKELEKKANVSRTVLFQVLKMLREEQVITTSGRKRDMKYGFCL